MDHRLIPGPSFDWQPSKQCSVAFGLTAKRGVLQSSTADWQTALFWWPKMIWYYRPFPEDNGSDKSDRKVWVVLPPRPWQGDPLRVPVASPPPWLLLGIEPIQSQQIVSPIKHSRETSLSLHPSTWRAFLPPRPQTISWRRLHREQRAFLPLCNPDQEGSCRAALPWNLPIDQGCFTPLEPRPTLRGLDAAILSKLDHSFDLARSFQKDLQHNVFN